MNTTVTSKTCPLPKLEATRMNMMVPGNERRQIQMTMGVQVPKVASGSTRMGTLQTMATRQRRRDEDKR
jgi:hypothetical protein